METLQETVLEMQRREEVHRNEMKNLEMMVKSTQPSLPAPVQPMTEIGPAIPKP
jgi:hypothetical protein